LFWRSISQVCPYYLPKFCQASKNILWAQVFYHFSMVIFSFWNLNMTLFWDARPVSLVVLLCEAGGPWWLIVSHYIFDIVLEIVYPMRSRALIPSSKVLCSNYYRVEDVNACGQQCKLSVFCCTVVVSSSVSALCYSWKLYLVFWQLAPGSVSSRFY